VLSIAERAGLELSVSQLDLLRDPNDLTAGGWGLWLVDQLADRWGVGHSHSTRVWLEFNRHPA
jgi:hypothetical protein